MDYRLIALDLDGTLNTTDLTITPRTREALIKVQEKGIKVVLASGRPTQGLWREAKGISLEQYGGYFLSYNGARLEEYPSGKLIMNKLIYPGMVRRVYDRNQNEEYQMVLMAYDEEAVVAEDIHAFRVREEAELNEMTVRQVEDLRAYLNYPVNKLLFAGEPSYLESITNEFRSPFVGQLSIYKSAPFYLEVMALGVDKASGLERLAKHMGITKMQVMAFGDGYNDLSMIEYAGMGIAMGNAVDELKAKAARVTASNNEDGIALVLEEMFL